MQRAFLLCGKMVHSVCLGCTRMLIDKCKDRHPVLQCKIFATCCLRLFCTCFWHILCNHWSFGPLFVRCWLLMRFVGSIKRHIVASKLPFRCVLPLQGLKFFILCYMENNIHIWHDSCRIYQSKLRHTALVWPSDNAYQGCQTHVLCNMQHLC